MSYNNGQWRHLVATLGTAGMSLYVDGSRVGVSSTNFAQAYDGYWRVGGDNLGDRPQQADQLLRQRYGGPRWSRSPVRWPWVETNRRQIVSMSGWRCGIRVGASWTGPQGELP
jgi:hypothetical protein